MSYYDLKQPIREIILREQMNFALIFPKDARKLMQFELYFFRTARVHPLEREYLLSEMSPNALLDFKYLGEEGFGAGDDILLMSDERPYRILHFGIGVHPEEIRVWRHQPAGYTMTGWSRKLPTKAGDPFDYFTGRLSPYDEPTRASETVMWLKGSAYFAVENREPVAVTPKLHILGAGYDAWLLDDRNLADRLVRGVIPCRFISVGGLAEIMYTVPDEWKGKGFTYGLEELKSLIRGG